MNVINLSLPKTRHNDTVSSYPIIVVLSMLRGFPLVLCLYLTTGCNATVTSQQSARAVGPEGKIVRAINPSANSTRQSNDRSDRRDQREKFKADRKAMNLFFINTWDELKMQAAAGGGELLDQLVDHPGCNCIFRDKLKKEIQHRQFRKIFRATKDKGWKQLVWIIDNNIYYREFSLYLLSCKPAEIASSPLLKTLIKNDSNAFRNGSVRITDNKQTYQLLKHYKATPSAHPVDKLIHDEWYEYAKHIRSKRLKRLLNKQRARK